MFTSSPGALRADLGWFGNLVADRKGSYLPDRCDPIVFLHSDQASRFLAAVMALFIGRTALVARSGSFYSASTV
jgi:hypothetical protein